MRITPLIGKKLWFVPRRDFLGWGWAPVSWEGWVTTAIAAVLIVVPSFRGEVRASGEGSTLLWTGVVVVLLLATCYVKGTSPGGRKQFDEFERIRQSKCGNHRR